MLGCVPYRVLKLKDSVVGREKLVYINVRGFVMICDLALARLLLLRHNPEDGGYMFLQNVDNPVQDYTALWPIKPQLTSEFTVVIVE